MRATRYVCHGALLGILGICLSLLAVGLQPHRAAAQAQAGGDRRAVAVRPASNVEAVACQPPFGSFGGSVWPPACWRPYTSGSPFNRPIPANPKVAPNSAAIMERMFRDIPQGPNPQPGHITANTYGNSGEPTYYSRASDPFFKIECTDFGGGCPVDAAHLPKGIQIPAGAVPEGGVHAALTDDRHMTIVDQVTGWEYDLWRVQTRSPLPKKGGFLRIGHGGRTRIDGDGRAAEGGGTASRVGSLAGRIRAEELRAGRIEHALAIVVNCDNGTAVYPARKSDQACSELGLPTKDAPPMGTLLQLTLTPGQIDKLPKVAAWQKPILKAMTIYGMYIIDTGAKGRLFNIETESGNQYRSLGTQDKWLSFFQPLYAPGRPNNVDKWHNPSDPDPRNDDYVGWLRTGVDWRHSLRVIAPCVTQRNC